MLKPCPFCGSDNIYLELGIYAWVRCGGCGAYGPYVTERDDAVRLWNARSTPTDPPDQEKDAGVE